MHYNAQEIISFYCISLFSNTILKSGKVLLIFPTAHISDLWGIRKMAELECFEKSKMLLSAKKWHPLILPLALFLPEVPLELKTCQMIIRECICGAHFNKKLKTAWCLDHYLVSVFIGASHYGIPLYGERISVQCNLWTNDSYERVLLNSGVTGILMNPSLN